MMNNNNVIYIADTLTEYRRTKKELYTIRTELREIGVSLGLKSEDVRTLSIADFLDGYLVAMGCVQPYRLEED